MSEKIKVKRQNKKLVLGDGEVTGHQHVINDPTATMFDIGDGLMELNLPRAATLRHEHDGRPAEHRDIKLPSGVPTISRKRQYDPEDGWSPVED